MRAPTLWRAKAVCQRAAILVAMLAGLADLPVCAEPSSTNQVVHPVRSPKGESDADPEAQAGLPAPNTAPASRADLLPAFTNSVPVSLADLRSMQQEVEALARRVSPAVVAVKVGDSSGSGVIISADGLVLTAGHVCGAPGRSARFTFPDGKTVDGKTLGKGSENDTGLMKIIGKGPWPYVPMGSLRQARVGDWVLALGHPGGFDARRSLVVRLGRIIRMDADALQTDCTISPGDSGGPLVDMHGQVIGIHNAISRSPAENFHVTISAYYVDWSELMKPVEKVRQETPPQRD